MKTTTTDMEIREANAADLAQVARVCDASARRRWTPDQLAPDDERIALVAVAEGVVIGAAKTHFHREPDGDAPAGHYLGGIVVDPRFRRQGVGGELTRSRLDWIWSRSDRAYYFTDEANLASIAMHAALGFQRVGRFADIRGVTADDPSGALLLFSLERAE